MFLCSPQWGPDRMERQHKNDLNEINNKQLPGCIIPGMGHMWPAPISAVYFSIVLLLDVKDIVRGS